MEDFYYGCYLVLAALIGLCVGSFLNVVIYRLPNGMSLSKPSSHCPKCGYVLKWYDNIPLLSYLILGGKCRKCKEHISFRYTIVEALNMLLWLLCGFLYGKNYLFGILAMIVCSVAICIFFIDLEHLTIPDRFQVILLVIGVVFTLFEGQVIQVDFLTGTVKGYSWLSHVIGFAVGLAVFYGIGALVSALMKREALGGGDIKLAAVSGLLLGWERLVLMILIASVTASVYMIVQKYKTHESSEIPFGPFLTSGLLIALLAGKTVIDWYLSFMIL